jgi:hypothetical protein
MKKAKYFDTCERCGLEEELKEGQPGFTQSITLKVGSEKPEKKDLCPACTRIVQDVFSGKAFTDSVLEEGKKPE